MKTQTLPINFNRGFSNSFINAFQDNILFHFLFSVHFEFKGIVSRKFDILLLYHSKAWKFLHLFYFIRF
jgi:hypothetical protein